MASWEMISCDASRTGPPKDGRHAHTPGTAFRTQQGVLVWGIYLCPSGLALWHFMGFSLCFIRTLTKLKAGNTGESPGCVIMRVLGSTHRGPNIVGLGRFRKSAVLKLPLTRSLPLTVSLPPLDHYLSLDHCFRLHTCFRLDRCHRLVNDS